MTIPRPLDVRYCGYCGGPIPRAAGECHANYAKKNFCCNSHGAQAGWNRRRGLPINAPPTGRQRLDRLPAALRAPAPAPIPRGADADTAVASFIAARGVTRCPTKFALPSCAADALTPAEVAARLNSLQIEINDKLDGESVGQWYRRIGGTAANYGRGAT